MEEKDRIEELNALTWEGLRTRCMKEGLKAKGKKTEMLELLMQHYNLNNVKIKIVENKPTIVPLTSSKDTQQIKGKSVKRMDESSSSSSASEAESDREETIFPAEKTPAASVRVILFFLKISKLRRRRNSVATTTTT